MRAVTRDCGEDDEGEEGGDVPLLTYCLMRGLCVCMCVSECVCELKANSDVIKL